MKWLEITVTTSPAAAEAVGDVLFQSRVGGIEELRAGDREIRLRAYLPVGPSTGVTMDAIRARLSSLDGYGLDTGGAHVETAEIDEETWAEAWKAHVRAFPIGRRLWITPTWDRTAPPPGTVSVELDPGMAFGSGLHPSTRMCLEVLDGRLRPGDVVADVGTGSGILAIAASKLGASRVLAVDNDPVAVAVARRNVGHNGVSGVVEVREGDLLSGLDVRANVILANLTADLHLAFLPTGPRSLAPGGILAASGIADRHARTVEAAAAAAGLVTAQMLASGEWRCLVLIAAP